MMILNWKNPFGLHGLDKDIFSFPGLRDWYFNVICFCLFQATKIFIEELNRQDSNNGPVAWSTAVKFLCARKFDVRRALDLYVSHQV